jgi:phosphohistidine swiveling domain-containing protein
MEDLSRYNWEKYVGRRQPPLRGELAFSGTIKWFKENGFKEDFSKLYIYFSNLTVKGIISDHYINNDLRNQIISEFKNKIIKDIAILDLYLVDFKKKTQRLKEFSLGLYRTKDFIKDELIDTFREYCNVWEDFGPNLYVLLLIIEGCEQVILDDFAGVSDIKTKLMKQVSGRVKSEFFQAQNNISEDHDYFPEKYNVYIDKLVEWSEYRDSRKVIYDNSWYKYSENFYQVLKSLTGKGDEIFFLSKEVIAEIINVGKQLGKLDFPAVVYADNGKIKMIYGKEVADLQQKIVAKTVSDSVTGVVACSGRVTGRVRLVEPHVANQIFLEGEILITRMTTPDLMLIIKKAAAIVTNEGGVTCHAAIVSRELSKPCIIGTKVATDTFKDGDLVEVDAERGVVGKIN